MTRNLSYKPGSLYIHLHYTRHDSFRNFFTVSVFIRYELSGTLFTELPPHVLHETPIPLHRRDPYPYSFEKKPLPTHQTYNVLSQYLLVILVIHSSGLKDWNYKRYSIVINGSVLIPLDNEECTKDIIEKF